MSAEEFEKYMKLVFAGALCNCNSCDECKERFRTDDLCPMNLIYDRTSYKEFCLSVYDKIMKRISDDEDLPFPIDWSEDDLINVLLDK